MGEELSREHSRFFVKMPLAWGEGKNSNSSFQLKGKIPQAGCLCYNVQLVNQKSGMLLNDAFAVKAAGYRLISIHLKITRQDALCADGGYSYFFRQCPQFRFGCGVFALENGRMG